MGQGSVAAAGTEQRSTRTSLHPSTLTSTEQAARPGLWAEPEDKLFIHGTLLVSRWGGRSSRAVFLCVLHDQQPPSLETGSTAVLPLRDPCKGPQPLSWVNTSELVCQASQHRLGELEVTDLHLSHCWVGDLGAHGRVLCLGPHYLKGDLGGLTTAAQHCALGLCP